MKNSVAVDIILHLALREAIASQHPSIMPPHLLMGMTKGRDFCTESAKQEAKKRGIDVPGLVAELSLVPEILEEAGMDPRTLRHKLRAMIGPGTDPLPPGAIIHRGPPAKEAFAYGQEFSKSLGMGMLHAGGLFAGVLKHWDWPDTDWFKRADFDGLTAKVKARLSGPAAAKEKPANKVPQDSEAPAQGNILERFGRDLTKAARDGLLPPVIGRRKEMLQVIQTLARKTKSNPVLVGEAGVGKTAIVEGIAQRIAAGKDTQVLGGKRIVEINMGALVAGTKWRGEFEERIKGLVDEAKADPSLILFIDEIHTMIGAGSRIGGQDAANMMKPALARGEIKCIGATTREEYRRYIEKDPALERRFDKVDVPEPNREEAVLILEGLRTRFEQHHGVKIGDDAIASAVDLSMRFDTGHRLPDKAIDLLDLACVQLFVPELSMEGGAAKGALGVVTRKHIAAVLADKVNIPEEIVAEHLGGMGIDGSAGLQARLTGRVMGQDEAIERVCNRVLLAQAALGNRRGPRGVFLFLGPSGVGKTELARGLAVELCGAENSLIRLDMSEYMEPHSVSRLVGSPPGYIGHDEEGQLTRQLRTTPYAIVLLDEVEKAHPQVMDIFLQVFDEGRITDTKGRVVDARNAIFIMTSNIGAGAKVARKPIGFNAGGASGEAKPEPVDEELKGHFRTELINRIDEVIRFKPLSTEAMATIAQHMLEGIAAAIEEKHGRTIRFDPELAAYLGEKAYSPDYGARELRRLIEAEVELPLARWLKESRADKSIVCHLDSGVIGFAADPAG
ncbi:MAG TPA: ATP-dependent Clp protease ATP-binding subunit [Kiritimatiellia bacterium]|nr:ATP-dependent Clp protease ATP-binding subunit [Kiritimatiellia bacterium]